MAKEIESADVIIIHVLTYNVHLLDGETHQACICFYVKAEAEAHLALVKRSKSVSQIEFRTGTLA